MHEASCTEDKAVDAVIKLWEKWPSRLTNILHRQLHKLSSLPNWVKVATSPALLVGYTLVCIAYFILYTAGFLILFFTSPVSPGTAITLLLIYPLVYIPACILYDIFKGLQKTFRLAWAGKVE